MNERIKELRRLAQTFANANCYDEFGSVDEYKRSNLFEEKFAELIVQECAKVCADSGMRSGGACTTTGEVYLRASKVIRAQFGMDTCGLY